MSNKEALVLSDTFQKTRDLTRWYLSLLKASDAHKRWEINGSKLNSIIWLASHITWAENFLILQGTGGEPVALEWLDNYNIKSSGEPHHAAHDMGTVMAAMKDVHEKAMAHIITLSDEKMEEENVLGFGFGGIKTNRMLIVHAVRHEAMHTGHLSWLCKINKVESI